MAAPPKPMSSSRASRRARHGARWHTWQAAPLQAQLAARPRTRRDVELHIAVRCGYGDARAQRRFVGRDGQVNALVTAVNPEHGVQQELDFQVQVARLRTAMAGATLARQAQVLTGAHALADVHFQLPVLQAGAAFGVEHRHPQRHRALRSVVSVQQVDDDLGVVVFTLRVRACTIAAAGARLRPASAASAALAAAEN